MFENQQTLYNRIRKRSLECTLVKWFIPQTLALRKWLTGMKFL